MSNAQAKSEAAPIGKTRNGWSAPLIFATIALFGSVLDITTKNWIFSWRGLPGVSEEPWWLVTDYVGIETAVNIGALFGLGAGYGWLFALLSIVAAIAIYVWMFVLGGSQSRWLTVAMGAVLAGIIGNLYDRLGLWYEPGMPAEWKSGVRDWILFRYRDYVWPNFNLADSFLVCGACMLAWYSFRSQPTTPET